ncbi:bifunctional mannitol-1-phosphate dehydrogenase/phosphatase [Hydrogenophaga sp. NFH-34]|uniref:bifunctional mannitol-1-phosphate dehydrogenase/phosphatase n=1 Tax=Hydrogenophaga sp. NFH-34 TaxID=2744446 RepID=UPI002279200E|nr:HAD family hydrolase [Hydrogenophaga sp. NFH-34]
MIQFKGNEVESALFDMDGTMFDTERLRFQTLSQAAEELFGKPFTQEVLIGSLGLSAVKAEELAQQHYGADFPYAEIRRRADELELAHVRTHGVPIKPGLLPVLERLRRSGLKMAVATSSRRAIAEEYLINANVFKYFDLLVCGDEVMRGKPHPEIFLKAAAALNSEPARCFMFEDSENGVRSAADAGGVVILVEDIKPPRPEVAERAFARYPNLRGFLRDLAAITPKLRMPAVTEPFPQAVNLLKAGIHGFGAMGGGYLAQVFSHWDGYTRPGEIIASTGNALLREAVNAFGKYSVRYGSLAFDQTIERMRMIDAADTEAIAEMYRDCEIVALCLPEQAIASQADAVAAGLVERYRTRGQALTVLVVLNKVGGAQFVRDQVARALQALVPPREARQILDRTEFTETVVTRIVAKLTEEALLRQLRIKHDLYAQNVAQVRENPMNTEALFGAFSAEHADTMAPIVSNLREAGEPASALGALHLILFNSETDMALYAQQGSDLLEHLRQIDTVADIAELQTLKNRLWNGTHAVIAWYAALLGHPTIGHAMGDARVQALMDRLLTQELQPALAAAYPDQQDRLPDLVATFRQRCAQAFKDPCERVGRDPLRKLQRDERVLGSLAMAQAQGIEAPGLALGAALAVWYALHHPGASDDAECATIRALFARRQSLADVLTWQGDYHGQAYAGLDPTSDQPLLAAIQHHFDALQTDAARHLDTPTWQPATSAVGLL